jgi:hypothetical protein
MRLLSYYTSYTNTLYLLLLVRRDAFLEPLTVYHDIL